MSSSEPDVEAVKAANLRFYQAFGSLDIAKMQQVWETSPRAMCLHPGWRLLTGWEEIRASWEGIFYNTSLMHFNITEIQVVVQGDSAWVFCMENISSVTDGRAINFGVKATNVFVRSDDGWRMVHHHASG